MSSADDRAALIARQGVGARWDAPGAPAEALLSARRGTAYFARLLNGLPDHALARPSRIAGWSRAQVVAHVGYHARALAEALAGLRGADAGTAGDIATRVARGASLPARALRGLFDHAAIHLDVEWRDLPGPAWDGRLSLEGAEIAIRATPDLRAAVIWRAALDLDAGGRRADLPAALRPPSHDPS